MSDAEHQSQHQKKPFNWRWFRNAAIIVVVLFVPAVYAWFSPLLNHTMYTPLLFTPVKKTDGLWKVREFAGHGYEDVYFQSKNGQKLHGWYFDVPNAKYTFLVHHGKGGNQSERVDEIENLLRTGCNVFIFDYEGYGLSEGEPSLTKVCDDSLSAYEYLLNDKHIKPERIILFGESLGTCIVSNLSTKVKSAGVVLQCPLASLRRKGGELIAVVTKDIVQLDYIYPAQMWPESGFDNVKIFEQPHPPLLVIAGTEDPMIPIAHADDLIAHACEPKTYVRIKGAGHTGDPDLWKAPEYAEALKQFLSGIDETNSGK